MHSILDDGMSAHQNLHSAIQQSVEDFLTASAFHDACQQGHTDVHALQEVHDGLEVLLGQNLRRSHDAGLIAVVQCDEHRHQRDEGLSATHVALQQTVHLSSATHILADFTDDTFLCLSQ